MEPLEWVFVVTALTLIFIVFAINPLQAGIDEAIQNHAQLQAQRLASMINIAESAPDGTTYTMDLPKLKCKVKITKGLVDLVITPVTGIDVSYAVSYIKTSTTVRDGEFECRGNNNVELRKRNGVLEINFK